MTTVKDIIKEYLTAHGHDGLCNPYCECGCDVDDIAPCGSLNERECQAAKRVTDEYGETIYEVDDRKKETVSERCFRTHFQDCQNCDDMQCGDNPAVHMRQWTCKDCGESMIANVFGTGPLYYHDCKGGSKP